MRCIVPRSLTEKVVMVLGVDSRVQLQPNKKGCFFPLVCMCVLFFGGILRR